MTQQEYERVLARIAKAESIPGAVEQWRKEYDDLLAQARAYEFANRIWFPRRQMPVSNARLLSESIINRVRLMDTALTDEGFRQAAEGLYSDLMTLAMTPEGEVLDQFGYREVAEDDLLEG